MRSKIDAKISPLTARRGKKPARPPGGKVMQRLIVYLTARDPALDAEMAAAVPSAAQAQVGLTTLARPARARTKAKSPGTKGAGTPAAKSLASAITKAAVALSSRTPRMAARNRPGAATPSASGWSWIGPSVIPKGQTYGTYRRGEKKWSAPGSVI